MSIVHRAPRALLLATLLILFAGGTGVAHATLRRAPGAWMFGPQAAWSDGSTSPTFHPLSEALPSAGLINARVSFELSEDSGLCKLRPALRYSADAVTWDGAGAIDTTYRTNNGATNATTYTDLSAVATPKAFVQFGVEVANESGTAVCLCNATVMVEPKER